ncbi:MAG: Gfo/Idh/MocA family oxidoreductase [Pseudomonadota bacterium]
MTSMTAQSSCAEPAHLRAGVIGAGVFGGHHARKYAAAPAVTLSGVYDADPARAAALADALGAPVFDDFSGFFGAVDVVTIAAPAAAHGSLARAALRAGKHVYIEKPVATDADDAHEIAALAAAEARVVQVGHQERFVAEAVGALALAADADAVTFERCGPPSGRCEEISAALDLMIHDLDLARRLGWGGPETVEASGSAHETTARLTFAGGRTATFVASRRALTQRRAMTFSRDGGPETEFDFASRRLVGAAAVAHEAATGHPALDDPLGYGVAQFLSAVRDGTDAPITAADGAGALDWALRVEAARAQTQAASGDAVAAGRGRPPGVKPASYGAVA